MTFKILLIAKIFSKYKAISNLTNAQKRLLVDCEPSLCINGLMNEVLSAKCLESLKHQQDIAFDPSDDTCSKPELHTRPAEIVPRNDEKSQHYTPKYNKCSV